MPGQRTVPGSDGLPALLQGQWSEDKLHFVSYFSSLFNGGMKNRWSTRVYVDLFAGPGLCRDRETGAEFAGSPLKALECPIPFTHLFFNDIDKDSIEALKKRQEKSHPQANVEYFNDDCNEAAEQIAGQAPRGALTLAFIDPWKYELSFKGLSHLGRRLATDLVVTFHSSSIKRNVHHEIEEVDAFLADENWRSRYWKAQSDISHSGTEVLIETFQRSLQRRLGYEHFGVPKVIRNSNGSPMFYVLFASKHPRGLDFWKKSSDRLRSGQKLMF